MNGIVWNGNVNENFNGGGKELNAHTVTCLARFGDPYAGPYSCQFPLSKNDNDKIAAQNLVKHWNDEFEEGPFAFCVEAAVLFVGDVRSIRINGERVRTSRRRVPTVRGLYMAWV